jgi:arsenate reductase (thioredoxin)
MSQTVLFLCPHNIAKSVIAAAYFDQRAAELGLSLKADSAGTEPEDEMMPKVISLLAQEGIDVSNHQPRLVNAEDLMNAAYVVSMNCDIDAQVPSNISVEHWDDMPPVSQDAPLAASIIRQRVNQLIEQLQTQHQ